MNNPHMAAYPRNSPRAAARILALALISNGQMQPSEIAALAEIDANGQLGITDEEWHGVVQELCVGLLSTTKRGSQCVIDSPLVEAMLDEIDDVALQRCVLRLCMAVIHADGEVDDGESIVLMAAVDRWELHPEEQPLLEPLLYGLDFEVAARGSPARGERAARGTPIPRDVLLNGPA
ncbi:hypothetical protein BH11PSE8_BH11PSE8_01230 [soil metagenome]